jgi:endonuclease YncB( thermonuclease family)
MADSLRKKLSSLIKKRVDWCDATFETCQRSLPCGEGEIAKVVRVVDGDSIYLAFERDGGFVKVLCRLRNIDTPELRSNDPYEKTKAQEARSALSQLCYGKMVRVSEVDLEKYGRLLASVTIANDKKTLSQTMLESHPELCRKYDGGKREKW